FGSVGAAGSVLLAAAWVGTAKLLAARSMLGDLSRRSVLPILYSGGAAVVSLGPHSNGCVKAITATGALICACIHLMPLHRGDAKPTERDILPSGAGALS